MYNSSKPWWKSKTVIGGLVALVAVILQSTGFDFGMADQQLVTDGILEMVGGAGAVLAVYGRVKATHAISPIVKKTKKE